YGGAAAFAITAKDRGICIHHRSSHTALWREAYIVQQGYDKDRSGKLGTLSANYHTAHSITQAQCNPRFTGRRPYESRYDGTVLILGTNLSYGSANCCGNLQ